MFSEKEAPYTKLEEDAKNIKESKCNKIKNFFHALLPPDKPSAPTKAKVKPSDHAVENNSYVLDKYVFTHICRGCNTNTRVYQTAGTRTHILRFEQDATPEHKNWLRATHVVNCLAEYPAWWETDDVKDVSGPTSAEREKFLTQTVCINCEAITQWSFRVMIEVGKTRYSTSQLCFLVIGSPAIGLEKQDA